MSAPVEPTSLPEQDELSVEWLADALGRPGALRSFTATAIGTGQVGSSVRYTLDWEDGSGGPATVVGKFPARDALSRNTGIQTESYRRELGFYRDLQHLTSLRTPAIYWAGAEDLDRTGRFVLLMEDLPHSVQGDQLQGCTIAAAEVSVAAAAGLHAPFWDAVPGDLDWLAQPTPDKVAAKIELYRAVVPGFVARYSAALGPAFTELAGFIDRNLEVLFSASRTPRTVVHGDYRLDNMLFARPEPTSASAPPPLVVVDFQTCSIGHGVNDVAYFIGAGLLADDRRAVERQLVEHYRSSLEALGVSVDPDDLWHDYVLGSTSGYIMAVIASQIVVQTERGDDMFVAMAGRHGRQMLDLEVAEVLAQAW